MLFSHPVFLFLFLPGFLALYFIFPKSLRNFLLLIASLFFYTWGEDKIVLIMLFSTAMDFGCGLIIDKGWRKLGLGLSLVANLSLLGVFKYFNFAFDNFHALLDFLGVADPFYHSIPQIALPIGISFYTFQTLSYSIDVYRGEVKASRNFLEFGAYVTMFPQLVAGPIVRYSTIQAQLKSRTISVDGFSIGVKRFVVGLAKKMLIANSCAQVADIVFEFGPAEVSTGWAWIGILAYSLQIYFDFSGYSDMAIGLGRMLGFNFLENFNYPYVAKSIQDFWRRWHISLSTWFRDYLYISLGGNRLGSTRTYVNLVIVFAVTGLWHGASWNFVVWGLFHGTFLILERAGGGELLKKLPSLVRHLYVLLMVVVGWVFFRADTLEAALGYLNTMFSYNAGYVPANQYIAFFNANRLILTAGLLGCFFAMPSYNFIQQRVSIYIGAAKAQALEYVATLLLFLLTLTFVAADSYNPFIYFRF